MIWSGQNPHEAIISEIFSTVFFLSKRRGIDSENVRGSFVWGGGIVEDSGTMRFWEGSQGQASGYRFCSFF